MARRTAGLDQLGPRPGRVLDRLTSSKKWSPRKADYFASLEAGRSKVVFGRAIATRWKRPITLPLIGKQNKKER